MKITRTLSVLGAVAALAGAAQADVKVVQAVTIDNPQFAAAMKNMSPEQKAQMSRMGIGGVITTTLYISGRKSRTDVGAFNSIIVDPAVGRMTTLNRVAHTYATQPFKNSPAGAVGTTASVTPTGKTKIILGHLCRDYRVSASSPSAPGGVRGDIWAAADLPRPPLATMSGGPAAALMGPASKIAGMPLLMTLTVAGSSMGTTTVTMIAKAVSTTPLPAATFAVPAGYKPGPAYGNPIMGGMGR